VGFTNECVNLKYYAEKCVSEKMYTSNINKLGWEITNIRFNRKGRRYLPGDQVSLAFSFHNLSNNDMYLHRIWLYAEWPTDEWQAIDVRDLIKSGQKRPFSTTIQVPKDITLGEYELRVGVEKQYLPATGYQDEYLSVEWSKPEPIHIKKPLNGTKIFISHSVQDIALIRQLAQELDNNGYTPIITEDLPEPGLELAKKFQEKIKEATVFLVVLTKKSIESEWVRKERAYAEQLKKLIIPLKEKGLSIYDPIEWIEFSRNEEPEIIASHVISAISNRLKKDAPQAAPVINAQLRNVIFILLLSFILVTIFFAALSD